jgi:hypothetical protein
MIQVFGENYYLDLEKIDEFVNLPNQEVSGQTDTQHISILKYEMVKLLTEVVLTEQDEVDEKLGMRGSDKLTIPYRLAWNTMLFYKFIQKI